jgi:hypothetical protein
MEAFSRSFLSNEFTVMRTSGGYIALSGECQWKSVLIHGAPTFRRAGVHDLKAPT